MWIRSKNEDKLINCTYFYVEKVNSETCKVGGLGNSFETCLGIYKTEEKALKILDEIQEVIIANNTLVYEMPQEE